MCSWINCSISVSVMVYLCFDARSVASPEDLAWSVVTREDRVCFVALRQVSDLHVSRTTHNRKFWSSQTKLSMGVSACSTCQSVSCVALSGSAACCSPPTGASLCSVASASKKCSLAGCVSLSEGFAKLLCDGVADGVFSSTLLAVFQMTAKTNIAASVSLRSNACQHSCSKTLPIELLDQSFHFKKILRAVSQD